MTDIEHRARVIQRNPAILTKKDAYLQGKIEGHNAARAHREKQDKC